jgi:putative flippase GtrA
VRAEESSLVETETRAALAATDASRRRESLELFLRFSAVGTVGFLVDVAVLYLALGVGFGKYSGRVVSYVCASTSTWALNRRFTFHARKSRRWLREWARFFVANAAGGASNYLVYATLVSASPFVDRYKVIGVAAGSIIGLAINFNLSRFVVFRAS